MKFVPNAVSRKVGRQILVAQKNSPKLLFVTGIAGFGATVVLASRATLKLDDVLTEHEKKSQDADLVLSLNKAEYTEQDYKKDLTTLYIQTAIKVTKLYAPSIVVGTLAVVCLTKSYNIQNQRTAAVTAALFAVENSFAQYIDRVRNEVGDEKEREIRYGMVEADTYTIDKKSGKAVAGKKTKVPSVKGASIYARWFDEYAKGWVPDPNYNKAFLNAKQNYANDMLKARGHVFLNEIYDELGIPRSPEGTRVGWLWDADGDNYIDFGVFNPNDSDSRTFVNGYESVLLLDFNVDGEIWDRI